MAARRHAALDRGAAAAQPPLKPRVRLTRPSARDAAEFLAAARRSRRLHGSWIAAPSTPGAYHAFLRRAQRPNQQSYFVRLRASRELAAAGLATTLEETVSSAWPTTAMNRRAGSM